nr:PTS system mannose/fructose/sorbose family transporter subunit IID [uncultured Schaedlerella sp.]
MSSETNNITKKDRDRVFWRWFLSAEPSWNYENMQANGFAWAMGPLLQKLHRDENEFHDYMMTHYQFFNTHKYVANVILGMVTAMEEKYDETGFEESRQAVSTVKTSLMGPLAGVGDTLFSAIPMTIFGAISASFAANGSLIGMFIGILFGLALLPVRKLMFNTGYKYGTQIITTMKDKMNLFINSATIIGLFVIGALIASFVSMDITATYTAGDTAIEFQTMLDSILPKILPLGLTGAIYYLLGKEKVTPTKIILAIFVLSFILYNTHILG